ncbi:MAG: WD40 repeat domain-containing protein [Candidatus Parabeggiatoa sp.]|nr:WD40 repeat domain-containing protein [Candidatus Parabeggiatoa sp.]
MQHKKLTIGIAVALGLATVPMASQADGDSSAECQIYAVNDEGLNNSQLFTVNPVDFAVNPLGKGSPGYDIEALDADPSTDVLYAASGDDGDVGNPGHLYTVDTKTGALTDLGSTGFTEIEGLTFHPDGTLWAWAKGDGLISIDDPQSGPKGTLELGNSAKVEDLTWNNAGTHIYASQDTNLWIYEHATKETDLACSNLPGETEAIETLPDGSLLLGIHGEEKILQFQAFDVETCSLGESVDIPTSSFNDVEGIAVAVCLPKKTSCSKTLELEGDWTLSMDHNCDGIDSPPQVLTFRDDATWSVSAFPNYGTWEIQDDDCKAIATDNFVSPPVLWMMKDNEGKLLGTYSGGKIKGCWSATPL